MNCFTHALPFLDDAYLAVGTCLPDFTGAFDRKCRLREKEAEKFIHDADPVIASVARGVVQHHRDDDWFHRKPKFNELILKFGMELRGLFQNERSMRPSLIGHIIVEMFLDAYLNARHPGEMERFYKQVESVDPDRIQSAANLFANRPTDKLVLATRRFAEARFLFDYDQDEGLIYRINQVLGRVRLKAVPAQMIDWVPSARERVYRHAPELLSEYHLPVH